MSRKVSKKIHLTVMHSKLDFESRFSWNYYASKKDAKINDTFFQAIRARFQLNILLNGDPDIERIKKVEKDLVMPFLWAGLGFDEPSELLANKVKFAKGAPEKLPLLGSVVFFVIGKIFFFNFSILPILIFFWVWLKI